MPGTNCLNLFAYGTLMDPDDLALALVLPASEVDRRFRVRLAEAPGFRRIYNKIAPSWDGAVLNIEFHKESVVVGVLYMDITNQELGMLDSSFPTHLPRKPIEVIVEGEKVPAQAYIAKTSDAGAKVSASYEQAMLALADRLGDPIRTNFREHTYRADGSPAYREAPPPAGAAPEPEALPAGPSGATE